MRLVVGLGAVAVFLFLAFQALFGSSTTGWNQRLTLVVETPQGEVRGSAVTRVENRTTRDLLAPGKALRSTLTGEAVAVEVLPGRWLFALLQGEDATGAGGWVYAAFDLRAAVGSDGYPSYDESMRKLRALSLDEPAPLPKEAMPLLVTFDDITRPETVREVGPDDLAAVFGAGVRLQAVTLEVTKEAVTEGRVEAVLGWLRNTVDGRLVPRVDMMDFSLSATLRRHQFIQRDGAL